MKKILFFALVASCVMGMNAQNTFNDFTETRSWKGDFAAGDIDGDGDLDIIYSSGENSGLQFIRINNGDGTFTLREGENVIQMGQSGNIHFGDIDGDGDLDVIFAGWGGNKSGRGIALNDGTGRFSLADAGKYPVTTAGTVVSCGFADFNLDGLLDYYFFGNNKYNEIYLQLADGSFVQKEGGFPELNFTEPEITIVDYDNNGTPDIFISAWSNDEPQGRFTALFKNDGTGKFAREERLAVYRQKANGTVSWGDVNGDGYIDFLLNGDGNAASGEDNNQIWRLYKNVDGNSCEVGHDFGEVARQGSVGNGSYMVDWNNDGKLDLLMEGWSNERRTQILNLYLGIDPANFTFDAYQSLGDGVPGVSEGGLRIADLDNDSKVDLLLCGHGSIGRRVTGWVKNNTGNASVLPAAPANLKHAVTGNKVTFSWEAPTSENGKYGTTYNLSLKDKKTGKWLYNPMANLETGWRKVGGRMGNVCLNKEYTLTLPDGEYEWTVQAINGAYLGGAFAETQIFTVGETEKTLKQTLYIDFGKSDGTNGNLTEGADANGHYWNNVASTESGSPSTKPAGYAVPLVNAANEATGFTLTTTEAFRANGRNNGGLLTPDPALLGDLAVATATEDYFFIENNQNDKGAFVLSGLKPDRAYKFYVFGSRKGTDNRTAVISVSGLNGSHGTNTATGTNGAATNDRHVFESGYVMPKANGEILVEVGILSGGFAYVNAMKIEEYSGYELPAASRKLYVDFGKNNGGLDGAPTASPDANGHYWNNMYSNGDGPTTEQAGKNISLVWDDNTASGFVLELADKFEFNGVRNGGLTNPNAGLLGDLAIATATQDYIFYSGDGVEKQILLKNLDKRKAYRFYLFGSRAETGANRIGFVQLTGSNSVTGLHQMAGKDMCGAGTKQNISNIFVSDPIVPDADGTVTLSLKEWLGNFFHINLMKVEELSTMAYATALSISGADAINGCGTPVQYAVKAEPEGAFCPAVTWTVDNAELARITENGKLYPLKDGTVTVTATAVMPDENVISATKPVVIAGQTTGGYSLAVMGSSVPYGQGAESGKGYAQLWASWLAGNGVNAWSTDNISIPGNNTTDVMNRWDKDLLPTCSKYVYYGLSLGNEGVHTNGQAAFNSYRDNMRKLIAQAREFGKVPLVGNNYARADFNESDYNYVKQLNLLIHEWDVPSVNLLGAIDNGQGQWAAGYQQDNAHPNTAGHAEMFYAIVPSLMDALAAGKPQPQRLEGTALTLERGEKAPQVTWSPEGVLHSFTLTFSFKTTGTGNLALITNSDGTVVRLSIGTDGKLLCERPGGAEALGSSASLNDNAWHAVTLTHYYAWGRTFLYVDGTRQAAGSATERFEPTDFALNSLENAPVAYRELYLHRAGMCAEEIEALHAGRLLQSSLEIYAPLDGMAVDTAAALENRAQSLNLLAWKEDGLLETALPGVPATAEFKEVSVYTLDGSRLMSLPGSEWKTRRHELPAGVYVVKAVELSGKTFTKKVVVEHF